MTTTLDCGHVPTPTEHTPGYGYRGERRECFACLDTHLRAQLTDQREPVIAYVSNDGRSITSWSGGVVARVTGHTASRSGFHRSELHRYWAEAGDARWYGSNAGPGMLIQLRRIKGAS